MRRRFSHSSEDSHENNQERWLISYADFITLLFAFFVILFATSERNMEKAKEVQKSVEKFLIKAGAFGESGAKIEQGEKNFSAIQPPISTFRQNVADDTKAFDAIQDQLESQFTEAERKRFLIDLSPDEKGVRIVLAASEIFSGDSTKFSPSAVAFLDHLGQIIKDQKKPVMIEGHVATGHTGTYTSTWDLASARSVNLLRYLSKKFALPENQLAAMTYGSSRPLAKAAGGAHNNRLELLIYYKDAEF